MAIFDVPPVTLVFLSGMLSALTPCILPILPPMLAGSMGHRLRPVFILAGAAVSFTLMGGVFAVVGSVYARDYLRYFFIGMLILMGAVYAEKNINEVYTKYSSLLVSWISERIRLPSENLERTEHPLAGAFFLGLSLGVVWIPCIGPILGSVLSYATYTGSLSYGSFLLLVYSLGLSLPVLALVYGGRRSLGTMNWIKRNSENIERFAGVVMMLTGFAILFGLDKKLQAALIPYISSLELILLEKLGML